MPKKAHEALKKSAAKKGIKKGTPRYGRYVYGTLNKIEKSKKTKKPRKKK